MIRFSSMASRVTVPDVAASWKRLRERVHEALRDFSSTVRKGRTRNGAVYMPPFEGTMNQEAVWAIKAYLETRREKPL